MMIARKFRFALIPAVLLGMVACNLNDQAHTPEKPASPAEPSEATVAVDTSLEGVDIDTATMNALMRESEALGDAGLAEEELDSANLDSLIRESGTSDSAIESEALDAAMGPIAAKTSAASNPCPYGIYKWGGGTCKDPFPVKKKKGMYISPLIGRKSLAGVASTRTQSICQDKTIQRFGVQVRVFPANKPLPIGRTHVSSIFLSCGKPEWSYGPYHWLPKAHPQPTAPHVREHRMWDGLLVGIRARSGDFIDALGPIMYKNSRLSVDVFGKLNGGTPKGMLCPRNYYVAGFIGFQDKNLRHGLTGLRMVCKEIPLPPNHIRRGRALNEHTLPQLIAQVSTGAIALAASHVATKHLRGIAESTFKGKPSLFKKTFMTAAWYKTEKPDLAPVAQMLNRIWRNGIFYTYQEYDGFDKGKKVKFWDVWVQSKEIVGSVFQQHATTVTYFLFSRTEGEKEPKLITAFPDWDDPWRTLPDYEL